MSKDGSLKAGGAVTRSGLYDGRVDHRRLRPRAHAFSYRVFSLLIDLDELPALDRGLKWFSRGRFNLFSFHDADYGSGKPADLARHIRGTLATYGIDGSGPLKLLCYPRILGYAFNPLAVYYCHDTHGRASAVLYEVSNTFGDRHSYLIPVDDADSVIRQEANKKLHVSPFMEMATRYHFRVSRPFDEPGSRLGVVIRQTDDAGVIFSAAFSGAKKNLTDRVLVNAFWRHPLMTVKVILAIHWEAVRLILKGMRLRAGDPAPKEPVTLVLPPQVFDRAA